MQRPYWLHRDSRDVVSYLDEYAQKWSLWNNSPFQQAWLRNFIAYYSPVINPSSWDTSLIFEGVQGELIRMYTPKARVVIRQLVAITKKQPLSFQAMAQMSKQEVIQDLKLANALTDQIVEEQNLNVKVDPLIEHALVLGKGFTKTTWRTDLGMPHTLAPDGSVIYTGGVEITTPTVFDVFYDLTYPQWDQVPWVCVRTQKNRWDLIAQHPEMETDILALPSVSEARGPCTFYSRTLIDEDSVYVFEFYARPSPALPKGRMLIYGDERTVFYDDENKYETLPVEPMTPEQVMTSGLGYPQFTNLMPAQEMMDNSLSAIATNQSQFAVQSVTIARGSNVNVQELNGMRFVSFTPQNVPGGGKPEPLQLTQSSPETFKFIDLLDAKMDDLGGIAGALKGSPPPGVTSGIAIATLAANALEFTQALTQSFQICMQRTMMHAINAYAKFGKIEQTIMVKGLNNQVISETFKGDRLKNIQGLKIITSNPLMQTIGGRMEIAQQLMQIPKDLWPQFTAILDGRPFADLTKGEVSQQDLITSENEFLMKGTQVPVISTDDHGLHAKEHNALLNDPNVRLNSPAMKVVLDHILEHERLAKETGPFLLAMVRTGKVPEIPQQMPPPPPQLGEGPAQTAGLPSMQTAEPAQDALQRSGGMG